MRTNIIVRIVVWVVLGATACASSGSTISEPAVPSESSLDEAAGSCPVTLPNGSTPPDAPLSADHGNEAGTLFAGLPSTGVVVFKSGGPGQIAPDGSLRIKWPWNRRGIRARLEISGRRLDAPAAPLRFTTAAGDGEVGFLASELIFPTVGCWEVTGRAADAELTFVVRVVKVENPVPTSR